jgi:hypothetical protein
MGSASADGFDGAAEVDLDVGDFLGVFDAVSEDVELVEVGTVLDGDCVEMHGVCSVVDVRVIKRRNDKVNT